MSQISTQKIVFLSTADFAETCGIKERTAKWALQRCHNGLPWKGVTLDVVKTKSQGGNSGLSYLVREDSIPLEFRKNTLPQPEQPTESLPIDSEPTEAPAITAKTLHLDDAESNWKISLVKAVIQNTRPHTSQRRQLVEELAAEARYPTGKKRGKKVHSNSIYEWIKAYEKEGLAGLGRKARSDARKKRVKISRKIDPLIMHLPEEEQTEFIDVVLRRVRSLWRNGTPSWSTVQLNALPFVIKKVRALGNQLDDDELHQVCLLPRSFIEAQKHYRAVAIRRKDAGLSATIQTPRIQRNRANLKPMEWVAGDVHHVDVIVQRKEEDGSISLCTPKAVAWLDLATNRAFFSLFLMKKGEMIRREHVIESFVAMCADPSWGVPTKLYLDRGGEYNWGDFIEDLFKLKHKVFVDDMDRLGDDSGIQRSRAYNPQSKIIETLFGILERSVLPQLPGHIGGNRMKKKTENQGKAPIPFNGCFEDFQKAYQTALNYYHVKPQQTGHIAGQSPNDRFSAFVKAGWKSLTLDQEELAVVFCKQAIRNVRAGAFSWNRLIYRHDVLLSRAGIGKILVCEPLFGDKSKLYVYDENERPLCVAEPARAYFMGDVSGAGEQQRQTTEFNRQIRQLEAETDSIDLVQNMRDVAQVFSSVPQAESIGTVSISRNHREAASMAREAQLEEPTDLAKARYEQSAANDLQEMDKILALMKAKDNDE